jgi:integrase/recombinase XerD
MLSVYTRHHPDCKNAGDKTWRRCNCPKWIWGSLNGRFIRQSAKTHLWEKAEEFRLRLALEEPHQTPSDQAPDSSVVARRLTPTPTAIQVLACTEAAPPRPNRPRVTIQAAVNAYLADAVSRNVAEATLYKLETIFRKQFLAWTQVEGFEYIDQIDLDALLNFRNTWADAALAKQKKQSRVIGFFWACVRRRYLIENPALGFGKIKVVQVPTDYFPPDEFQGIGFENSFGQQRAKLTQVVEGRLHGETSQKMRSGESWQTVERIPATRRE